MERKAKKKSRQKGQILALPLEAMNNQPIVIDNGSGLIKAGFAGTDRPRTVFRSFVGRSKHVRIMPGGSLEGSEFFIGSKAEEHKGVLSLSYPIEHGVVTDWGDMEKLWAYIYSKDNLNVSTEDHAVLLTETSLNPAVNREKAGEIFFEGMNVPALYISMQAILSLYASGRTTGIVLDCGDGVSHTVPIYEGFALPHAISRIDLAGRDITEQLKLLLKRNGHNFYSSAETEIVRQIKESMCVIALNPSEKEKEVQGKVKYQLPDGSYIQLGSESYRAPEILFQPGLVGLECSGIHDLLCNSINKTDLAIRKVFYSSIMLSGGTTLLPGFGDRLLYELRQHALVPKENKLRIAAPSERINTTWIGGSILASLTTFKNMWISKSDYQEHGSRLLVENNKL